MLLIHESSSRDAHGVLTLNMFLIVSFNTAQDLNGLHALGMTSSAISMPFCLDTKSSKLRSTTQTRLWNLSFVLKQAC